MMKLTKRLLWLYRWVRTPYVIYEDVRMEDGRWYAIPFGIRHECCTCGNRHFVLVYWDQDQHQLFWNWDKDVG